MVILWFYENTAVSSNIKSVSLVVDMVICVALYLFCPQMFWFATISVTVKALV